MIFKILAIVISAAGISLAASAWGYLSNKRQKMREEEIAARRAAGEDIPESAAKCGTGCMSCMNAINCRSSKSGGSELGV